MDYHAQYQFTNGQPYQAFMPMPPLTPSNSHSVSSDDFNNTSPEVSFSIPPVYASLVDAQPLIPRAVFWLLGTESETLSPLSLSPLSRWLQSLYRRGGYMLTSIYAPQAGFDNIQASADAFRGGFEYPAFADASQQPGPGFPSPPMPSNPPQQFAHPQQAHHSIPAVPVEQKPDGKLNVNGHVNGHANGNGNGSVLAPKVDAVFDDLNQARAGSDDDENLTPAQSRRKAQNRAA